MDGRRLLTPGLPELLFPRRYYYGDIIYYVARRTPYPTLPRLPYWTDPHAVVVDCYCELWLLFQDCCTVVLVLFPAAVETYSTTDPSNWDVPGPVDGVLILSPPVTGRALTPNLETIVIVEHYWWIDYSQWDPVGDSSASWMTLLVLLWWYCSAFGMDGDPGWFGWTLHRTHHTPRHRWRRCCLPGGADTGGLENSTYLPWLRCSHWPSANHDAPRTWFTRLVHAATRFVYATCTHLCFSSRTLATCLSTHTARVLPHTRLPPNCAYRAFLLPHDRTATTCKFTDLNDTACRHAPSYQLLLMILLFPRPRLIITCGPDVIQLYASAVDIRLIVIPITVEAFPVGHYFTPDPGPIPIILPICSRFEHWLRLIRWLFDGRPPTRLPRLLTFGERWALLLAVVITCPGNPPPYLLIVVVWLVIVPLRWLLPRRRRYYFILTALPNVQLQAERYVYWTSRTVTALVTVSQWLTIPAVDLVIIIVGSYCWSHCLIPHIAPLPRTIIGDIGGTFDPGDHCCCARPRCLVLIGLGSQTVLGFYYSPGQLHLVGLTDFLPCWLTLTDIIPNCLDLPPPCSHCYCWTWTLLLLLFCGPSIYYYCITSYYYYYHCSYLLFPITQ